MCVQCSYGRYHYNNTSTLFDHRLNGIDKHAFIYHQHDPYFIFALSLNLNPTSLQKQGTSLMLNPPLPSP